MNVFWQFRNGRLSRMTLRVLQALNDGPRPYYYAWDRSLGGFVLYDR